MEPVSDSCPRSSIIAAWLGFLGFASTTTSRGLPVMLALSESLLHSLRRIRLAETCLFLRCAAPLCRPFLLASVTSMFEPV